MILDNPARRPTCCVYLCPPPPYERESTDFGKDKFRSRQICRGILDKTQKCILQSAPKDRFQICQGFCSRQKHKLHFCISRVVYLQNALCVFVEGSSTYLSKNPRQIWNLSRKPSTNFKFIFSRQRETQICVLHLSVSRCAEVHFVFLSRICILTICLFVKFRDRFQICPSAHPGFCPDKKTKVQKD